MTEHNPFKDLLNDEEYIKRFNQLQILERIPEERLLKEKRIIEKKQTVFKNNSVKVQFKLRGKK